MSYTEFRESLKSDAINSICLFYGKEVYLVDWAIKSLVKKYINVSTKDFDLIKFSAQEFTYDAILNACETVPLFSERKIVIVDYTKVFAKARDAAFSEEEEIQLEKYLHNIPQNCILILLGGEKVDSRIKIIKTIKAKGNVFEFGKQDRPALKKWIEGKVKKIGKTISPRETHLLIDESGYEDKEGEYTLYHLENDIIKICAYAEDTQIKSTDICDIITGNIDKYIFTLTKNIGEKKIGHAMENVNDMLRYGIKHTQIIFAIHRQFDIILKIASMLSEGHNIEKIQNVTGLKNDYALKTNIRLAKSFHVKKLEKIISQIYETDKKLKTTSAEPEIALELLITSII